MKIINILVLLVLMACNTAISQTEINFESISMTNDIKFNNAKFDKTNLGNGFLIKHGADTFAITAKQILLVAKTDSMKTTHFKNGLKQWTMYPKDKPNQTVVMGELLNSDRVDSLNWGYVNRTWKTYQDWLIFKIRDNTSEVRPIEIRTTKLIKGEPLYVVGWTFNDKAGEQRVFGALQSVLFSAVFQSIGHRLIGLLL